MIKSKVTVIGNVTRSADIKNGRDGQPFITFGMRVRLEDGEASAEIDISVAYDGEDEDVLFTNKGDRVKVQGVMTFKKMGDTTYYNLSAEKVGKAGDGDADSISGTLQFRGTFNTRARRAHSATSMRTARRRSAMTSSPTSGCISWTSGTTSASG